MSSIKRDVKNKLLPRPGRRYFLEIQPTVHSPLDSLGEVFLLWLVAFAHRVHLPVMTTPIES